MSIPAYMPVYRRSDIQMIRGEGCYLYDRGDKAYLDFATGIAVNSLGHNHPHIVEALKLQADQLWHCSNLFRNAPLEQFSQRLVDATFADSCFFCSSGTEAIEAAIKLTRYHFYAQGSHRQRIIAFSNGFHGRSMAAISAGGNAIAREGFYPLLEGFDRAIFNDIDSVKALISADTAAILIEPIQGEGGVHVADKDFMQALRALCDEQGILLILDEVQCGMGRPGKLFAYEHYGITPDLLTTAKGIGNGFPLAACLASQAIVNSLKPGVHGSTYGSNPLAMAVGNAVLDIMLAQGFFVQVQKNGNYLFKGLSGIVQQFSHLYSEVRGMGLMLGVQMHDTIDHRAFAAALCEAGLLVAPAYGNVLRILPSLVITQLHIDEAVGIVEQVSDAYEA